MAEYKTYVLKLTLLIGHFLQVISRDLIMHMLLHSLLLSAISWSFQTLEKINLLVLYLL